MYWSQIVKSTTFAKKTLNELKKELDQAILNKCLSLMCYIIKSLEEISYNYSIIFCDVWGCIHNGVSAFEQATFALNNFKMDNGVVVLLTNAPRPSAAIHRQLNRLGVDTNCYDLIVTAGDAALQFVTNSKIGEKIYHLGPEKDSSFFNSLFSSPENIKFSLSSFAEADLIICTGLFDDSTETPDDYEKLLEKAYKKNLPMICTNPDIHVDFGKKRVFCAGAIASAYQDYGGKVHWFGKPYTSIYDFAVKSLTEKNFQVVKSKVLCVGDGLRTDIKGANDQGLDSLFIAHGLEKQYLIGEEGNLDVIKLEEFLKQKVEKPNFVIDYLK